MIKDKKKLILLIFFGTYIISNIFFIEKFPFMHSDESWLSGLTRTMMNEGLNSTETFFDILPRYPHAIKSLFHIVQMPFLYLLGYNVFAVRFISLIFSCILLYILFELLFFMTKSTALSVMSISLLAFDVQYIYASHFARQEIIIACGIILLYYLTISNIKKWSIAYDIKIAVVLGVLIGFHPNAFIAALIVGSIYLYYILIEKEIKFYNLLVMSGAVLFFALIYIGASYLFDPDFIKNYLSYGDNLGVSESPIEKIRSIKPFYQKIWLGISGTYYTPCVKVQLILFSFACIAGIVSSFKDRKTILFLFPVAAVNIGYILIGRFSQPSILFVFISCWLLIFYLVSKFIRYKKEVLILLLVTMLGISVLQIKPYINNEYNEYIVRIRSVIPENSRVLANLNTDYAFKHDKLRDYRNLAYLQENQIAFSDYVEKNRIEYIIYPEEIDYIYYNRPVWNILYGNIYPFYDDMKEFFETDCQLVDEFYSPYAMRIVKFSYDKQWQVKIYRVEK